MLPKYRYFDRCLNCGHEADVIFLCPECGFVHAGSSGRIYQRFIPDQSRKWWQFWKPLGTWEEYRPKAAFQDDHRNPSSPVRTRTL